MRALRQLIHLWVTLLILGALSGCIPVTTDASTTGPAAEPLIPTAGQVHANGMTIAYESFGPTDRETVLLIAGTGQQLVDWPMELIEALVQRGYRVVRFDNRDVGLSTKLTDAGLPDQEAVARALEAGEPAPLPYTLQDMARDAVGLLDALEIEQAHLAGMSMGGAIAQLVAIDYPERILSLTTIGADSGNPDLPVIANPEAFARVPPQPTSVDPQAYLDWQVKTWQALSGPEYPTAEATLREWAQRDFERGFDPAGLVRHQTVSFVGHIESASYRLNNLENIAVPTVVLQGTADPLVPVASAEDIAARVPDAELWIIPGLGHFIPVELVPEFAEAITAAATRATTAEPAGSSQQNSLAGTRWQLVSFGAPGDETPVIEGSAITLEFGLDGQSTGSGSCNSYGGEYHAQDSTLSFNQIIQTEMACVDTGLMDQEQHYFQALQTAGRFELTQDQLMIWYDDGQGVLNLIQASSPTPDPTTASPVSTPTVVPAATPAPDSDASVENPTRIVFGPGETGAEIQAVVEERGTDYYVLQAQQGQVMSVEITSPNNDVLLTVVGEDGTPLKRYQNGPPAWTSQLPATQEYFIHAVSVGPRTPYTLRVEIVPLGPETAERVEFEPGAISAQRGGLLPSGPGIEQYLLAVNQGQTMTVDVTSDDVPLSLTIESPSGQRRIPEMRRTENGCEIGHQFTLPETRDYRVTVGKADHTPSTNYTVMFTIQ